MTDKDRLEITRAGIEMYLSLQQAMTDAGGGPLTPNQLEKMSALELIAQLSVNKIRLTAAVQPKEKTESDEIATRY